MRLFSEHNVRRVDSLDGAWRFSADKAGVGDAQGWYSAIPDAQTVVVPSCWNTQMGLLDYEGVCWYERDFYTEGGTLRFFFGAVMTEAKVYLDGTLIGSHYGGFCEFDIIVNGVASGTHRLTVRVDNSFDAQSIPQKVVDWYHYGGITRSVSVEVLKGVCVLYNRFEYELSESLDSARARFAFEVYNASADTASDKIGATVCGVDYSAEVTLSGYERREVLTDYAEITDLELWQPESPRLYNVAISTSTDDLMDRVGFRRVEVRGYEILLNGRPYEVRGVNRHEEHPEFGMAFPPALMRRDIDIAVEMGCNSLRGSHYPQAPVFIDMLDECGVTFWSEIPIWGGGFSEECLADPVVLARGEDMHREMVRCYYNHPSIIIWGMHNEIKAYTESGKAMCERYYPLLKEIGGNRLVTYATSRAMTDISLEYCDVICINQYEGWYQGGIDTWEGFVADFHKRADSIGVGHKPIIMSEFGAAAVYGHRSFDNEIRWSEDYQARLISHCLELFHADPKICGSYIWQFTDIRTCLEVGLTRARGYNNKGVVNEHRNPKASYFTVKEIYNRFAREAK